MLSKISLTAAVVSAGKCPFGFDTPATNESIPHAHPRVRSTAQYPSDIFTCPALALSNSSNGISTTDSSFTRDKYKEIIAKVVA
jgi:hypothetical protein